MTTIQDDPTPLIARRLKLEREARGWSLADLAERSGVAKATISKIEREEASPTAVVLVRLSSAFGLTLAGFMLRAEEAGGGRVVRAGEQPVWRDPATGYRRRQIFARPDNPVELVELEMPPERSVPLPAASYALIRQVLWVTAGRLVVEEGGERHELTAGDCLGFGPPSDVVIANPFDQPATYVVALSRR